MMTLIVLLLLLFSRHRARLSRFRWSPWRHSRLVLRCLCSGAAADRKRTASDGCEEETVSWVRRDFKISKRDLEPVKHISVSCSRSLWDGWKRAPFIWGDNIDLLSTLFTAGASVVAIRPISWHRTSGFWHSPRETRFGSVAIVSVCSLGYSALFLKTRMYLFIQVSIRHVWARTT